MPKLAKVFCIGFQKTGTSSVRDALQTLGYKVRGVYGRDVELEALRETYVERGLELATQFDAVEDMPWPLLYKQLDEHFPGSKFILTWRETDRWYSSISGHFGDQPYHIQQLTYGDDAPAPVGHEQRYRSVYEAHNAEVRDYFRDRPEDLLVMNLEDGDGWDQLGAFLNITTPGGPFVRTNTSTQRRSLVQRVRRRLSRLGLPVKEMHG